MKSNHTYLLILLTLLSSQLIYSQLTSTDTNYIKKHLLSLQDDKGLFSNSFDTTNKAVYVLRTLNESIPNIKGICREISLELLSEVSSDLVELNQALKCKADFSGVEIKDEHFTPIDTLGQLYDKVVVAEKLKAKVDYASIYDKVKKFVTQGNFFSEMENGTPSLLQSALGLKLLTLIHKTTSDNNIKKSIVDLGKQVLASVSNEIQHMGEVRDIIF